MAEADEVRRVPDADVDGLEGWERITSEPLVRAVEAIRLDDDVWPWIIVVRVMEFVRSDPLEALLRYEITGAIADVDGVTQVAEEDREVWVVAGRPSGEALVRSVAAAVDALATQTRPFTT